MRRIYKYKLETADDQTVMMPINAKILCVQVQNEIPCLWAIVHDDTQEEARHFSIYGTGHQISPDCNVENYIGTYQIHDGRLVFHVFEHKR